MGWDFLALSSCTWRRAALEGSALAVLLTGVLVLARPKLYETVTTFTLDVALAAPDSARADAGNSPRAAAETLLAFALERAHDPPSLDPGVRREFSVDLLRNLQLQLVCRAERAEIAEHICQRVAFEALARFPVLRHASPPSKSKQAPVRLRDLRWQVLLIGLCWALARTSVLPTWRRSSETKRAAGRLNPAFRESRAWWVPNRAPAAAVGVAAAPSPKRTVLRPAMAAVRTLVGMPGFGAVSAAARAPIPTPVTPAATEQPASASRSDPARPDEPTGTGTHVIYHVSKAGWSPDPAVLGHAQLDQLRELSEKLARDARAGSRVIRVVSDAEGRHAKSQVAAQLGWLLAELRGARVLLMEADLDAPALHRVLQLNVPRGFGLSEQLERAAHPDNTSNTTTVVRLTESLHALVESRWGTPKLLDSPQLADVLALQRVERDYIVLDGPIIDTWVDAKVLKDVVDRVVFVVASGSSVPSALQLAHSHFSEAVILGIVRTGEWRE